MKVYLAGPISNMPGFNFPAFDQAAKLLRNDGHEVYSPAEEIRRTHGDTLGDNASGDEALATKLHGFNRRDAMKRSMVWICDHAEAIALLPGSDASSGAIAEYCLAKALGISCLITFDSIRNPIMSDSGFEQTEVQLNAYRIETMEKFALRKGSSQYSSNPLPEGLNEKSAN